MEKSSVLESFKDYLALINFSVCTQRMYYRTIKEFYNWRRIQCREGELNQEEAKEYLLMRLKSGMSWSTINCDYSALRKFFTEILNLGWSIRKIPRPKQAKQLPIILSKSEVSKLISCALTYKHQVFLTFVYATGLRLGEACGVLLEDVDSGRMQLRVRQGKGKKDRYVVIAPELLDLLRVYYKKCRPINYLFNGRIRGEKFSRSTGQFCVKAALKRAGIEKNASIHTLRHCYATHHIESGTNLVCIKEQLGHNAIKTTAAYIHLCVDRYRQINHPLKELEIQYIWMAP